MHKMKFQANWVVFCDILIEDGIFLGIAECHVAKHFLEHLDEFYRRSKAYTAA
jgi:hypothetical protein